MFVIFDNFFPLFRTLLQFSKKKRKRSDSGSDADMDVTPPPSPKVSESALEKRRSGRHSQRKKYVDDVDLNLSDDETLLMNLPPEVAAAAKAAEAKEKAEMAEKTEKADKKDGLEQDDLDDEGKAEVPASDDPNADPSLQSGPNYAYVVSIFSFFLPIH